MIENLPKYIELTFVFTTVATLLLFCWAVKCSDSENTSKKSGFVFWSLSAWLVIQAIFILE